jgi:prepilin-type N-terminal cleavage/methylation domain-containing protein
MAVMRRVLRCGPPLRPGRSRGFTLIELMAVVVIITVFAALALPSMVVQMRDRRVQEAARRIGLVYRQARLRALGRGSAVLVRVTGGAITVHEARLGTAVNGDVGCIDLPVSSCLNTDWSSLTAQRVIDGFQVATSGELSNITLSIADSAGTAVPNLDICFTPMGRGFERRAIAVGTPFAPFATTYVATVSRPGMTRPRQLALMPNGTARLVGP